LLVTVQNDIDYPFEIEAGTDTSC